MDLNATNKALTDAYKEYDQQIRQTIFNDTEKYSRPYYCGIVPHWCDNGAIRIMVVGQEGRGFLNGYTDSSIQQLQQRNLALIDDPPKGKFWARINNICKINQKINICYNNLDKIHLRGQKYCKLSTKERNALHSIKTNQLGILHAEINILQPQIVVICGYTGRKQALKQELPSTIFNKLYSGECIQFKKQHKIYCCEDSGITYILTHHPEFKSTNYENAVIECIEQIINQKYR